MYTAGIIVWCGSYKENRLYISFSWVMSICLFIARFFSITYILFIIHEMTHMVLCQTTQLSKGQLISKFLFGVFKSTKNPTKFL